MKKKNIYKLNSSFKIKESKSELYQDSWVSTMTGFMSNGTFVDIGAGHPIDINNTYALETEKNWKGISVDIGPPHVPKLNIEDASADGYKSFWKSKRNSPIIVGDALDIDYLKLFKEHKLPKNINYLSLDIEPPSGTFKCLKKIPFSEYTFDVITFETDFYREKDYREASRDFFRSVGYILARSNKQEDWWIHPSLHSNLNVLNNISVIGSSYIDYIVDLSDEEVDKLQLAGRYASGAEPFGQELSCPNCRGLHEFIHLSDEYLKSHNIPNGYEGIVHWEDGYTYRLVEPSVPVSGCIPFENCYKTIRVCRSEEFTSEKLLESQRKER